VTSEGGVIMRENCILSHSNLGEYRAMVSSSSWFFFLVFIKATAL